MLLSTTRLHPAEFHVVRLLPGDDLLLSLRRFVDAHHYSSAFIAAIVGSVGNVVLRPAGRSEPNIITGKAFEILSLSGTLESEGPGHLHLSIADENCIVVGGHVLEGCIVRTTAEVIIGVLPTVRFARRQDDRSGYEELFVEEVNNGERAEEP